VRRAGAFLNIPQRAAEAQAADVGPIACAMCSQIQAGWIDRPGSVNQPDFRARSFP